MSVLYQPISACRVCASTALTTVVDLGDMALTGVFPKPSDPVVPKGPLRLVRCDCCGLTQLADRYDLSKLYGNNYGYRSGLNRGMVRHLGGIVADIETRVTLSPNATVIDIGANDGTLLSAYSSTHLRRLGVDPSAEKFRKYYHHQTDLIVDFFPSQQVEDWLHGSKAMVITSIACFYDLEDPLAFAQAVRHFLADDGVWIFEQSYLPTMLAANAFDTICHEHVEYYSLAVIDKIVRAADMQVHSVTLNDANGGSFRVWATAKGSQLFPPDGTLSVLLEKESALGLETEIPWASFNKNLNEICQRTRAFLTNEVAAGRKVLGYGASTKGNVLLQRAGIDSSLLPAIVEVNEEKFGCVTPDGGIPIISEAEGKVLRPDAYLVLPWHFRSGIVEREQVFLSAGGRLVFPMPSFEVVSH